MDDIYYRAAKKASRASLELVRARIRAEQPETYGIVEAILNYIDDGSEDLPALPLIKGTRTALLTLFHELQTVETLLAEVEAAETW